MQARKERNRRVVRVEGPADEDILQEFVDKRSGVKLSKASGDYYLECQNQAHAADVAADLRDAPQWY